MTVHVTGSGPHECKTARRKNLKLADSLAGQFGHIYSKNPSSSFRHTVCHRVHDEHSPGRRAEHVIEMLVRYRKRVPDNHWC